MVNKIMRSILIYIEKGLCCSMNIVQTLSSGKELLKLQRELSLLDALDIKGVRFNLCKFAFNDWEQVLSNIKKAISVYGERFELFLDVPYPQNKARIRKFSIKDGIIKKGERYVIKIDSAEEERDNEITVEIDKFDERLKKGTVIYFGDGEGAFEIRDIQKGCLVVEAINGFTIFENKGITCGYVSNRTQCIKNIEKISWMFDRTVTILLSFLQTSEEIDYLKGNLNLSNIQIIPKIELIHDTKNLPELVSRSDGALLARGDMGLLNNVSDLLEICRVVSGQTSLEHKRLFAATDILSSYKYRSFPSRADLFDLCILHELGCTDIILSYPISEHINEILNLVAKFQTNHLI